MVHWDNYVFVLSTFHKWYGKWHQILQCHEVTHICLHEQRQNGMLSLTPIDLLLLISEKYKKKIFGKIENTAELLPFSNVTSFVI